MNTAVNNQKTEPKPSTSKKPETVKFIKPKLIDAGTTTGQKRKQEIETRKTVEEMKKAKRVEKSQPEPNPTSESLAEKSQPEPNPAAENFLSEELRNIQDELDSASVMGTKSTTSGKSAGKKADPNGYWVRMNFVEISNSK